MSFVCIVCSFIFLFICRRIDREFFGNWTERRPDEYVKKICYLEVDMSRSFQAEFTAIISALNEERPIWLVLTSSVSLPLSLTKSTWKITITASNQRRKFLLILYYSYFSLLARQFYCFVFAKYFLVYFTYKNINKSCKPFGVHYGLYDTLLDLPWSQFSSSALQLIYLQGKRLKDLHLHDRIILKRYIKK